MYGTSIYLLLGEKNAKSFGIERTTLFKLLLSWHEGVPYTLQKLGLGELQPSYEKDPGDQGDRNGRQAGPTFSVQTALSPRCSFGGDLPSEENCKVLRFLCRSDLPLGVKFIMKETSSSPLKCECMPPANGPGP